MEVHRRRCLMALWKHFYCFRKDCTSLVPQTLVLGFMVVQMTFHVILDVEARQGAIMVLPMGGSLSDYAILAERPGVAGSVQCCRDCPVSLDTLETLTLEEG